jgi:hypothetical protein
MLGVSGVTVVTTAGVALFFLPTRLRVHRVPGIPCALPFEGQRIRQTLREKPAARMRNYAQLSSPGSTGRPSIPETPMIEPRSRGVLDRPLSRATTTFL